MEKLEFKKSGFWYEIWLMSFGNDFNTTPPRDICSYRAELIGASIVAVLLFPVTISRFIYHVVYDKYLVHSDLPRRTGVVAYMIPAILYALGFAVGETLFNSDGADIVWWHAFVGMAIIIALATAMVLIAYLVYIASEAIRKYSRKSKKSGTVRIMYDSWKNKYCTPIEWKNKNK